jgi:hypothetical protein
MPTYSTPGVYVSETALSSLTPAATGITAAAFFGEALRGPITPVLIQDWNTYKSTYGELANAYEVPVMVVSSLAREGYKNDAKPNLYNSKESGDIEYATTIGLAMWREANEAQITMEIQKNRDGKAWEQFKLPPMIAGAAWYDVRQQ